MTLVVVSPAEEDRREPAALGAMIEAGLGHYHLRKPGWPRAALARFLALLPADWHPRLVLHTCHELVNEFGVAGLHHRACRPPPGPFAGRVPAAKHLLVSRTCHDTGALPALLGSCDRVLLSPIFNSLSKPGYEPDARVAHGPIAAILAARHAGQRRTEVCALGGIDASRLAACRALGFDGVAVLGAIWNSADPRQAFLGIRSALLSHAAT